MAATPATSCVRTRGDPDGVDSGPGGRRTSRTSGTTRSPAWSTPVPRTGSPVLRALRRHQGHGGLRGPVPQRLPAGLRRGVEPPPGADRHRQAGVLPQRRGHRACPAVVVEAMGDGTGAVMLDGKMEDDASVKQCLVLVELAEQLAERDPELEAALRRDRAMTDDASGPAGRCSTCRASNDAGAREGQDHPERRADPRSRGRRRARREACRARGSVRGGRVGEYGDREVTIRVNGARHRVARATTWRPPAPPARTRSSSRRWAAPTPCSRWSRRWPGPTRPTTRRSGRWSRRRRRCCTPRRSPRASERLDRAGDGHQRPRQGAARRAGSGPRTRCCPGSASRCSAARAPAR